MSEILGRGEYTLADLTDAPIGILSNESFVLAADLNGVVGSFSGVSTTLSITLGGTDDSANWSVSAGTPVGITGSLVGKTYTVTAMSSDIGYVDLTASRAGFSNIVKRFSVAKAKQGPAGSNGQSLYTWVKYADNSLGSGMSDSSLGKNYIGLAYNKATATESSTVGDYTWSLIRGPQGSTGQGVSAVVDQYYLSTSNTIQTGGSWGTSMPAWSTGKYIWTRSQLTWINPSATTHTTPVLAVALNTASANAATALANASTAITNAAAAQGAAEAAQTSANSAFSSANAANTLLADMADDNRLTPAEKNTTREEWQIIQNELDEIASQAALFSVSSSAYVLAFDLLDAYLNNETTGILLDMDVVSDINRGDYQIFFQDYYYERQSLLNAITNKAKDLANAAQDDADSALIVAGMKNRIFYGAINPYESASIGDLWFDSGDGNHPKRFVGIDEDNPTGIWVLELDAVLVDVATRVEENLTDEGIFSIVTGNLQFKSALETNLTGYIDKINNTSLTLDGMKTTVQTLTGTDNSYEGMTIAQIADARADEIAKAIRIGGRNLLLNSREQLEDISTANIKTYEIKENLTPGKTYIFSLKGSLGAGKPYFRLLNSAGTDLYAEIFPTDYEEGVYTKTFVCPDISQGTTIILTQGAATPTDTTSDVYWAMLETGSVRTDWVEAPEDMEARLNSVVEDLHDNYYSRDATNTRLNSYITTDAIVGEDGKYIFTTTTDVESAMSSFKQTADGIYISFTKTFESMTVEDMASAVATSKIFTDYATQYFDFDPIVGLTIGEKGEGASQYKTVISDGGIEFKEGETTVASITQSKLMINNAGVAKKFEIGNDDEGYSILDVVVDEWDSPGLRCSWRD